MLDMLQNTLVFLIAICAAVVFMLILNRVWPREKRSPNNDLIGWQLSTTGTTYAVILGFMLYTVWTTFGAAQLNVDLEANSLRNLYRLADGLPAPQRTQLQGECRSYVDAVLNQDWPAMANNRIPEGSHSINQAMWQTLMSLKTTTGTESLAEDHALSELSNLTEHRRTRLLQSAYRLPGIFWIVLIAGGLVTTVSVAMFGAKSNVLHTAQVASYVMLTTLVLLAISDVNLPFQGWVQVSRFAFVRAQQYMPNE